MTAKQQIRLTLTWLSQIAAWLMRAKLAIFTALFIAMCLFYLCRFDWTEPHIRWASLVLQIGGVLTVAIGVANTRKDFGHASTIRRIAAFFHDRPRLPKAIVGVAASIQATELSKSVGSATVGVAPDRTVEGRLEELERRLQETITRTANEIGDLRTKLDTHSRRIEIETEQRSQADAAIQHKIEMTATGGLDLSLCGVVLLLLGSILGTIPAEIASIAGRHF